MKQHLRIDLANIVIDFCSLIKLRAPLVRSPYRSFFTSKSPTLRVFLEPKQSAPLARARKIFQTGDRYAVFTRKREVIFDIFTDARPGEDSLTLIFDAPAMEARILLPASRNVPAQAVFDYPLDQLLLMSIIPARRGMILHGCCGVRHQKAYLFLGNSGAGKTTISRILHRHGFSILSDDRVIVMEEEDGYKAYGTPWSGSGRFFSSRKAPVERIFFLCHGRQNRLIRLAAQPASARLLSFAFVPYWDPRLTASSLACAVRLIARLGCQRLAFRPDDSVARFLISELS